MLNSKSKPEPKADAEAMSKQEAATEAKPETVEAETESPLMLSQVFRVMYHWLPGMPNLCMTQSKL